MTQLFEIKVIKKMQILMFRIYRIYLVTLKLRRLFVQILHRALVYPVLPTLFKLKMSLARRTMSWLKWSRNMTEVEGELTRHMQKAMKTVIYVNTQLQYLNICQAFMKDNSLKRQLFNKDNTKSKEIKIKLYPINSISSKLNSLHTFFMIIQSYGCISEI